MQMHKAKHTQQTFAVVSEFKMNDGNILSIYYVSEGKYEVVVEGEEFLSSLVSCASAQDALICFANARYADLTEFVS